MPSVKIQTKFLNSFFPANQLETNLKNSIAARELLDSKSGKGADYLGWTNLPKSISKSEIEKVLQVSKQIKSSSEYLVVIGIGGSYLGARAIIEANINSFSNLQKGGSPKIIYAGHHIDSDYHKELLDFLEDKDFSVNVISKSGTTTEPALVFRSIFSLVERKYGKSKLNERIFSTTDKAKGALKKLSDEFGLTSFVIPDDVGGRFSVLTPVGLLPISAAGIDIEEFISGAVDMQNFIESEKNPEKNLSLYYASLRNTLYQSGKKIELLVNYNPKLQYFTEWWKQLFGESEGKEKKGIFPAGVNFTTDLHSMGQYIQDGLREIFETVIRVENANQNLDVKEFAGDPDGLNYIAGKNLSYINSKAIEGTLLAHYEGGVPNIEISIPKLNPSLMGELVYFFEYACGVSGYMLGVNPFDQPGVEDYKNNMFALLGKKGFEEMKKTVEAKLNSLGKS